MLGGGFERRKRSYKAMPHGVAEGHEVSVGTAQEQSADGGLFVGHGQRAVVFRPACAIAGIERVVILAGEIIEAVLIEPAGVIAAEERETLALHRGEVGIVGVCLGAEEIGGVAAHLVQVDTYERVPLAQYFDLAADFGLGERNPVAV